MFHPAAKHGIRERETGQGATPINPDRYLDAISREAAVVHRLLLERRRIYQQQQAALAGEMSYDTGTGQGATPIKPRAQAPTAEDMIHPAVARGDNLPPGGAAKAGGVRAYGPSAPIQAGIYPHTDIHTTVTADTGIRAQDDNVGESVYGEYANNVGPRLPVRELGPAYQRRGRDVGAGYLNNPFDQKGREQIGQQFWQAPLGGHVRSALEGQEVFGHTITKGQARMAEQGLAGLTAVGVGVPAFLAAVNQLSTPQTPDTIPMV